jgi:Galactose oxidase, central domain
MFWPQSASAFSESNSVASSSSSRSILPRGKSNSHGYWTEIIPRFGVNQVPCPRSMHAGAVWHSNLYIFGGYDGRNRSNDLHVYHFPSNSWALLGARGTAPSRRDRHTAVVYLNKLVIFGGYDGRARVNGEPDNYPRALDLMNTISIYHLCNSARH